MMSPEGAKNAAAAANASAVARDSKDADDDDAAVAARVCLFKHLAPRPSVSKRTNKLLPSTAYLQTRRI
jgi:hypothetical protein